jgi:hypothetical protein
MDKCEVVKERESGAHATRDRVRLLLRFVWNGLAMTSKCQIAADKSHHYRFEKKKTAVHINRELASFLIAKIKSHKTQLLKEPHFEF